MFCKQLLHVKLNRATGAVTHYLLPLYFCVALPGDLSSSGHRVIKPPEPHVSTPLEVATLFINVGIKKSKNAIHESHARQKYLACDSV